MWINLPELEHTYSFIDGTEVLSDASSTFFSISFNVSALDLMETNSKQFDRHPMRGPVGKAQRVPREVTMETDCAYATRRGVTLARNVMKYENTPSGIPRTE